MTEEVDRTGNLEEESGGEGSPSPESVPVEHSHSEPSVSADNDPILVDLEDAPPAGLMSRLNPLKLFRGNKPENFVREGRDLMENGSYAQATVAFQHALEIDPHYLGAFRGLGKIFYKRGGRSNLEQSLKFYQEGIKHHPKDHELYAISAKIYDALGKRKEATLERKKFVIVRALDHDPSNPVANNNMGILYLQQGRAKDAIAFFKKALKTDKNYDVAHRNMGAVYLQMAKQSNDDGQKANFNSLAKQAIQRALEISPTPPSMLAFARMQLKEGSFDEVLALVEKLDQMIPANKDVYLLKKMALEGLGRFEEAQDAQKSLLIFAQEEGRAPEPELEEHGGEEGGG